MHFISPWLLLHRSNLSTVLSPIQWEWQFLMWKSVNRWLLNVLSVLSQDNKKNTCNWQKVIKMLLNILFYIIQQTNGLAVLRFYLYLTNSWSSFYGTLSSLFLQKTDRISSILETCNQCAFTYIFDLWIMDISLLLNTQMLIFRVLVHEYLMGSISLADLYE